MNELKNADEIERNLHECACEGCPADILDAADMIESLTDQLAASQRREQAAVDAIRKSLRVEKQQRPNLNRCHECAKRIVDS